MLLPDNIHPELSIYYSGSLIIEELLNKDNQLIVNLYQKIKDTKEISFPTFILSLDWLYLIEAARISEGGRVELCL